MVLLLDSRLRGNDDYQLSGIPAQAGLRRQDTDGIHQGKLHDAVCNPVNTPIKKSRFKPRWPAPPAQNCESDDQTH